MASRALLLSGAALAGLALLRRESPERTASEPRNPSTKPRPYYNPDASQTTPQSAFDRTWQPAYLTEYHPDAPPSKRKQEGGLYDRNSGRVKHPVVRWEQHAADPKRYPFVTTSGDLVLRGRKVPYGARVYLEAYPEVTFRLFDTGSHFYGEHKVIRIPGAEPFDIATSYPGPGAKRLGISGTKTRYWVDFDDVIDYPAWLAVKRDSIA